MFNLNIEGAELFALPFGDIVPYFSVYSATLAAFVLIFILISAFDRPERQLNIIFGGDAYYEKEIKEDDTRFSRFMAIACGFATLGAVLTGDIFNFTLFAVLVGITNIAIVASAGNRHVLNAAFQYGIVAMIATVPLFGAAAIILATTGTLSIWTLAGMGAVPLLAKALLILGVMGEGIAPLYIGKAEIIRAQGAPFVLMIHFSSLLLFLRVTEIVLVV
jgi:energy-converting hydrogenase A subunit H